MGWWVADLLESNPAMLVSWVVVVIGSIVLHELAHGWAAIRCGDRTPIELGHMTWNPLVHMGPMSLLFFALIGFAWGAMPVNPSRFRRWEDRAFVAAAGPFTNLLLAVAFMLGVALVDRYGSVESSRFQQNVLTFFEAGAVLNVLLMTLNLLPIPPLDGSRIVATYLPAYDRFFAGPRGPQIALLMMLALFFFGGRFLFGPAQFVAVHGASLIYRALP